MEGREYLAGYMGVHFPKLDVDVVVHSCEVANWRWRCSSSSGTLVLMTHGNSAPTVERKSTCLSAPHGTSYPVKLK